MKTNPFAIVFFLTMAGFSRPAFSGDYELRASYGTVNTAQGGMNGSDSIIAGSLAGVVLTGILQSPLSWLDFGLQFEQLSSAGSGNRDVTFRRLGLVFEKEIRFYSFFIAPEIVLNFVNIAHYGSAGTELWRANGTFAANFGGSVGYRFRGVGIVFNAGYRRAQLGKVVDAGAGATTPPSTIGGAPDFSGLYLGLGVTVLL